MGLKTSGLERRFHAFDTFSGALNFKSITGAMGWIPEEHPEYQIEDGKDSFFWLWQLVMKDAYPTATGHAGYATSKSVHPAVWNNQKVSLLSVDSIKFWDHFKSQLGGLQPTILQKGAIFAFMDFQRKKRTDIPNILYGCLREKLQPVYTSWCVGEPWIFVVVKDFSMQETASCMEALAGGGMPDYSKIDEMLKALDEDLEFMGDLHHRNDSSLSTQRTCVKEKIIERLTNPAIWGHFRK